MLLTFVVVLVFWETKAPDDQDGCILSSSQHHFLLNVSTDPHMYIKTHSLYN